MRTKSVWLTTIHRPEVDAAFARPREIGGKCDALAQAVLAASIGRVIGATGTYWTKVPYAEPAKLAEIVHLRTRKEKEITL
jgi:hypothetical protein